MKKVLFEVDEKLYETFRSYLKEEGLIMKKVLTRAIELYNIDYRAKMREKERRAKLLPFERDAEDREFINNLLGIDDKKKK